MKNHILSTALILITTLTISLAQNNRHYDIAINEEVFATAKDRKIDRVEEARVNVAENVRRIVYNIMDNCHEFNIVDEKITNDRNHEHDEIKIGPLQDSKTGIGQQINAHLMVMSYIKYKLLADQNYVFVKFALVNDDFVLNIVEERFSLSDFNENDIKEAEKRDQIMEKMLKKLLDFKRLKNREGYHKISKKCICSRTKTQRTFSSNLLYGGGSLVVGLATTTYGTLKVLKANEQYGNYGKYDYTEHPFYTDMGITRDEFLKDTQRKNQIGYTSLGAGLALTAIGAFGVKIYFDCRERKSPSYSDATMDKKPPQKSLSISPLLDYDPVTTRMNSQIRISYRF